ncbi:MAG: FkbM family methyltransferase [Bacteroidota bacterium]|nr:FkbM family methyltransferase [Bacteroidota bacterium]
MRKLEVYRAFTLIEIVKLIISSLLIRIVNGFQYHNKLLPFKEYLILILNQNYTFKRIDSDSILLKRRDNHTFFIIRPYNSDIKVFEQILILKEYQYIIELLSTRIQNKTQLQIIDCGSNIGLFTYWLMSKSNNINAVCIEANRSNFEFQKKHLNRFLNQNCEIKLLQKAIWNEDDITLTVSDKFRDGDSWSQSVSSNTNSELSNEIVKSIQLNTLYQQYFQDKIIDVLKIDIEGAEIPVFSNIKSLDKVLRNTRVIAIEIHEELSGFQNITNVLEKFEFRVVKIGEITFGINKIHE